MRAHNVIIVTSGRVSPGVAPVLDGLIKDIVALNKTPILVLGPDGDDLLRLCEQIEHCEIVYDPNFTDGYFAGIKAGLHATIGAAFVVPLAVDVPARASFARLEAALIELETSGQGRQCHVLGMSSVADPQQRYAAPLVVTAHGVRELMRLSASTDWDTSEEIMFRFVPARHDDSQMTN